MSLLPECPVCGGLMTRGKTTLRSACRCGYPEKVGWDNFPQSRERDPESGWPKDKAA